jgi:hydroxyacylglutathione hydrolase
VIRKTFQVGILGCNCTIIADIDAAEAIVVDPGGDADSIIEKCVELGVKIKKIILTHGHFDHILAADEIRKKCEVEIFLNEGDRWLFENIDEQGKLFGLDLKNTGTYDQNLEHQQMHQCGASQIETLHTPGHSPGSVCFHLEKEKLLFSGDTLFAGAVGRSDIWKGSQEDLIANIKKHLLVLDEATIVIPGHGAESSIGSELRINPFLQSL